MSPLARREGLPVPAQLAALRAGMRAAATRFPLHAAAVATRDTVGGIPSLVVTTRGATRTLVWFHGGGFRLGAPEISAGFVSQLAVAARLNAVLPYYSLAPESPFPAALLDGGAVLQAAAQRQPVLLGGDSAGANLATALALQYPACASGLLLISPWLDLRLEAASFADNRAVDPVFSLAAATAAAAAYLQGHPPTDPRVSPLVADLAAVPATLILAGSGEVLLDDAIHFARRAIAAARPVSLHVLAGMTHVEPVVRPDSPFAGDAVRLGAAFCRSLQAQSVRSSTAP